jgi:ABC-type nitrate/sulfonate/bicarbonate transport system substrate-binding protein
VVLDGKLAKEDPKTSAAIARALIRGAKWTGENREKAAKLGVEKKLWKGDEKSLGLELRRYMWMPGVNQAKEHLKTYIHEGIGRGSLPAGTDEKAFFEKIFVQVLPDLS